MIESNVEPYAWWAIDWNDGSGVTSVTGLSMSQTLSHIYTASGVYTPVLYVDNQEGVALTSIVAGAASSAVVETSAAVVETENVFSAIAPLATTGALFVGKTSQSIAAAPVASNYDWNAIAESLAVASKVSADDALVVNAGEREIAQRQRSAARDDAFAELSNAFEFGDSEDGAVDALATNMCEALLDDGFFGELFEE